MTFSFPADLQLTDDDRLRARRRGAADAAAIAEYGVEGPPASPTARWVWAAVMGRADTLRYPVGSVSELRREYSRGREDHWISD